MAAKWVEIALAGIYDSLTDLRTISRNRNGVHRDARRIFLILSFFGGLRWFNVREDEALHSSSYWW